MLLVFFGGQRSAGRAHRELKRRIRARGAVVLDTTVLEIDGERNASVRDPRRVVAGAATSTLPWGVFGLLSGGVASMVASAALGAIWGGAAAFYRGHHATKAQLARLGEQLPSSSSALLMFAETGEPGDLLKAAARSRPSTASVAAISDDLTGRVLVAQADRSTVERTATTATEGLPRLSMILVRYRDRAGARAVAAQLEAVKLQTKPEVELVVETDADGRRCVIDPELGAGAIARYNLASWTLLGLVCGAIGGAIGDGGFFGLFNASLLTALAWGVFGAAAGALYGSWAGRAVSARRLRGVDTVLTNDSSTLLAWGETPLRTNTAAVLAPSATTRRRIVSFAPTHNGATLELID